MALTSASTLQNALDQYKNNLSWDGDLTKARDALEAIRFIEMCRPQIMARPDAGSYNFASLERQARLIEAFLEVSDSTNHPTAPFVKGLCKEL